MKLIKKCLRNKTGDDFLRHYMVVYIEKDITAKINVEKIIDLFDRPGRRSKFKLVEM